MPQDIIRYDVLVQEALKSVVRKVLTEAQQAGLPGDHHFYISFDTQHPGVRMSSRLRQRHPEEMTIVLQHQFWDLGVTEHTFEVGLSFGGIPERLLIPFNAVKGFFDPSVQFGLQFDVQRDEGAVSAGEAKDTGPNPLPAAAPPPTKPVAVTASAKVEPTPATKPEPAIRKPEVAKPVAVKADTPKAEPAKAESPKTDAATDDKAPATVVSLDAFRKKT